MGTPACGWAGRDLWKPHSSPPRSELPSRPIPYSAFHRPDQPFVELQGLYLRRGWEKREEPELLGVEATFSLPGRK